MFSAMLIALASAGAQIDLPTQGVTDAPVISAPPPAVAPPICWSPGATRLYFRADPMLAAEVRTIARVGPMDVAFLPTNGLNVGGKPAVMSSDARPCER